MSTKFYVYGGGRWRELDINTGRVSGWAANARLLVARHGRLECARAAPVLRALRALADNEPSPARDGPRLPHISWAEEQRRSHKISRISPCRHCCQHRSNGVVQNACGHAPVSLAAAPPAPMAATPAPASLPAPPAPAQHSTTTLLTMDQIFDKLKNDTSPQADPRENRGMAHLPNRRAALKRKRSPSSSVAFVDSSAVDHKGVSDRTKHLERRPERKIRGQMRGRPVRRDSGNVLGIVTDAVPKRDHNSEAKMRIITVKKISTPATHTTRTARRNGHIEQSGPSKSNAAKQNIVSNIGSLSNKTLQPKLANGSLGNENSQPVIDPKLANGCLGNETSQPISEHKSINKIRDESQSRSGEENHPLPTDGNALFAYALHSGGRYATSANAQWSMPIVDAEVCKELVIDEDDVAALRAFLVRSAPEVSVRRFDYDDEYKRGVFYRLNPLVIVERSEQVRRMLGADQLSLRDFASQLGLRSVSDEPVGRRELLNGATTKSGRKRKQPDRYSGLASPRPNKSPIKKQSTSAKPTSAKNEVSNKVVPEKRVKRAPETRPLTPPPAPPPPSQPNSGQQTSKPARGKGGGFKEYSRAEDAAIVNWISSEGRARLVNGNRVWRELQEQFQRLTGNGRTWQSLRNRYLRYILSSLSSLAVAPGRAARLRADAAAGEIKSKRWPARRNSMFATPGVRGAWSRRPRSPLAAPAPSPPRPPRHRPSSSSSRNQDAGNSSSDDAARAVHSSSSEKPKRPTRASSTRKPTRAQRSSSSEELSRPMRSSFSRKPTQTRSSEKPTRPARSPYSGKFKQARGSSSEKRTRPTHSSSSGKPNQARRSPSSEKPILPTRSSSSGKANRARRSSSSEKPTRPMRSSSSGKPNQARRSSSSEKPTRPTRSSSSGKLNQARRSSSSEKPTRPTRSSLSGKPNQARRSSSSEKPTRPTRSSSSGKPNQARRSSSSEKYTRPTRSSTSRKPIQTRRSSSSSSSSHFVTMTRSTALRYSEVTRRFASKQKARQVKESTSPTSAPSPPAAPKGPRSRRLFNPKAAL